MSDTMTMQEARQRIEELEAADIRKGAHIVRLQMELEEVYERYTNHLKCSAAAMQRMLGDNHDQGETDEDTDGSDQDDQRRRGGARTLRS